MCGAFVLECECLRRRPVILPPSRWTTLSLSIGARGGDATSDLTLNLYTSFLSFRFPVSSHISIFRINTTPPPRRRPVAHPPTSSSTRRPTRHQPLLVVRVLCATFYNIVPTTSESYYDVYYRRTNHGSVPNPSLQLSLTPPQQKKTINGKTISTLKPITEKLILLPQPNTETTTLRPKLIFFFFHINPIFRIINLGRGDVLFFYSSPCHTPLLPNLDININLSSPKCGTLTWWGGLSGLIKY